MKKTSFHFALNGVKLKKNLDGGEKTLSAIAVVFGKSFAVFCGETMFCLDTGEKSRIEKVKMVKDQFLYGFTGRNVSAVEFFGGLIDDEFNPTEQINKLSYIQLIDILDKKFEAYKNEGVKKDFDTCAIICGPMEGHMQCTRYLIKSGKYEKETTIAEKGMKMVGSFLDKHFENYNINKDNEDIVMAIVDAFQAMVDKGIEFDESINNEVVAYFINKGCDRPYITEKLK